MTDLTGLTVRQAIAALPEGACQVGRCVWLPRDDGSLFEAQTGIYGRIRQVHTFPPELVAKLGDQARTYHLRREVAQVLRRFEGGGPVLARDAAGHVIHAYSVRAIALQVRLNPDGSQLRAYAYIDGGGIAVLGIARDGRLTTLGMMNGLLALAEFERQDQTQERLVERHEKSVHVRTLGEAMLHARSTGAGILGLRVKVAEKKKIWLVCEVPVDRRAPWVPHFAGVGRPDGVETTRETRLYWVHDPWNIDPADLGHGGKSGLTPTQLSVFAGGILHPGRPTEPSVLDRQIARAALGELLMRIPEGAEALPDEALSSRLAPLVRRKSPEHFTRSGLNALLADSGTGLPNPRAVLLDRVTPGKRLMEAIQDAADHALLVAAPLGQGQGAEGVRWCAFAVTGVGPPDINTLLMVDIDTEDRILSVKLLQGKEADSQLRYLAPPIATPERARDAAILSAAALEAELASLLTAGLSDTEAMARSLRPRPGDAAKVFRADVADRIAQDQAALWEQGSARIQVQSDQTRIRVNVSPAGMLSQDSPLSQPFPGGYKALAEYLEPSRIWATWVHHAPGRDQGMRYDGLVWVDDHWAWFPKPWRSLKGR